MGVKFNPFSSTLDVVDSPSGDFADVELNQGTAAAPSISFNGDPNTGIYSPGADQVAISTNGTGRLFIDASGNVGVGNSVPSSYFSEADNLVIGSSGNNGITVVSSTFGVGRLHFADGTGTSAYAGYVIYNHNNNSMQIGVNSSEAARIDSSGRLGLGTSSPSQLLHLSKSSGDVIAYLQSSTANYVGVTSQNSGGNWYAGVRPDAGNGYGIRDNTATAIRLLIDSSGNVGIGTTSPSAKLEIGGIASSGSLEEAFTIDRSDGTQLFSVGYNSSSNDVSLSSNNKHLVFANGTSSAETARIDQSGRLLVGTSSALDTSLIQLVNSGGGFIASARDDASVISGNSIGGIKFYTNATDGNYDECARIICEGDGTHGDDSKPSRLVFSTTADSASSPTERMIIKNNGNILVGTNSDAGFTFQVSRAAGAAGYFNRNTDDGAVVGFGRSASLVGTISVTTTATAYNTSSDYRLKENVVPLTGAADRLNQLQVHRFNFIADPDTTVDGFIAHEAQAVVPECVTGTKDEVDADGNPVYQGIDQSKLVPLLTAALQEAIAEIESLKGRLTAAGI